MIELLVLALLGAFASGPVMWENLPTCDMTRPVLAKCREVRGQWGGTIDGRVHRP